MGFSSTDEFSGVGIWESELFSVFSGLSGFFWAGVLRVLQMFLSWGWFNPENEERRVGRVFIE